MRNILSFTMTVALGGADDRRIRAAAQDTHHA